MKAAIYNRRTLPDLLLTAAETSPQKGVGFVQSDGSIKFTTFPELLAQAMAIGAVLQARGLSAGDKVMIVMTRNEDIIPLLWACFLSGLIPTILQPPVSFTDFNQPAQKIENVFKTLKNSRVILSDDLYNSFNSKVISKENLININDISVPNAIFNFHRAYEDDIAFIQFSSGSTGDPKGIVLSHKNIITNLAAIGVGLDLSDDDVESSWMPLYHDMGLFGFHICPLYGHSSHYLIDPIDFIKKPSLWIENMSNVGCTITGSPNFGQALVLRFLKNKEEKEWDLSLVKAIVNGAEPISKRVMTEFLERLSIYGLRKEAMMPAYGMAENTLAMTFSELLHEPVITTFNRSLLQREGKAAREKNISGDVIELVSVGKMLNDVEIRILDELGTILEEGMEGHIQIKGAGVTSGYYNNPETTAEAFDGDWLRTGDKGFFFDGNLYITGRVKDIIFVRGQNLYAHDLENLASKHSDIPYGKVIVGGLFDQKKGKDLILLFLVGSANQATCDTFLSLRNFFRDTYGINIDVFVPVRSNQVPKTSSGKIQRYKLITDYQNGEFDQAIHEIKKLIRDKG